MLRGVKELHGTTVRAQDGEVGKVDEILFDDIHWTVRYLIVDTGTWLASRKVLLSPMSFGNWDWFGKTLSVNLTRNQIENSPGVDTDKPVSRQWEKEYYGYYGWPYYWGGMGGLGGIAGMGGWGSYWYPGALLARPNESTEVLEQQAADRATNHGDADLRSTKEVTGYGISASDGHIGHIEDFIVDDESWRIRYLAVDTRDWWPGKKVLLPPDWIGHVNWPELNVTVTVTQDQVKNAPEWDHNQPIDNAFEERLYSYYSRQRPLELPMKHEEETPGPVPMF